METESKIITRKQQHIKQKVPYNLLHQHECKC